MSACREGKRKTETTLTLLMTYGGFLGERGVSDWRRPKGGVAEEQRAAGREGVAGGVGLQLGKRAAERRGPVRGLPTRPAPKCAVRQLILMTNSQRDGRLQKKALAVQRLAKGPTAPPSRRQGD